MGRSMVFTTLTKGQYADHYDNIGNLIYCGQRSGRSDSYIEPGTMVMTRERKTDRHFDFVGFVDKVTKMQDRTDTSPAIYMLELNKLALPIRYQRLPGDLFTHDAALRAHNFSCVKGAMAQGIYRSD